MIEISTEEAQAIITILLGITNSSRPVGEIAQVAIVLKNRLDQAQKPPDI